MNSRRQIQDPFHNPFHNRFHVPVHSRLDEMQAQTHMAWLNDSVVLDRTNENKRHSRLLGSALAGAFALLLVVIFSATLLAN